MDFANDLMAWLNTTDFRFIEKKLVYRWAMSWRPPREEIPMRRVIIESPYAGDTIANVAYAHKCVADCLSRGEAPYASHLLYTTALDDTVPAQRTLGINAGLVWGLKADATVVYVDRGVSRGMLLGIRNAEQNDRPVEYRMLKGDQ